MFIQSITQMLDQGEITSTHQIINRKYLQVEKGILQF